MFLAITRKIDFDGNVLDEVEKAFIEISVADVAKNLEAGAAVEYYAINLTAQNATLKKASIKTGARQVAPAREIVEVEADGVVVGSVEVEA